jgi:hypothetical protein
MDEIGSLLVHPNLPDRKPLPIRENPLSYKYKLSAYGFEEVQQEFSILHSLPPLLMTGFDPDDLASRECIKTTDFPEDQKWKLMFMCSIFGSRSLCLKD